MKTIACFIFCILALSLCSQNVQPIVAEVDSKLKEILAAAPAYKKVDKVNTSTTHYSYYMAGNKVKFIEATQTEEGLKKNVRWYYEADKLLFTETLWTR